MTQDINNPKHFIADEGKVFFRVYDGFKAIEKPFVTGSELILGKIIVDSEGNRLAEPIDDDIHYYNEDVAPVKDENSDTVVEENNN